MIAGEIGEQRHVKGNSVDAFLMKRMRADLHYRFAGDMLSQPGAGGLGEDAVQLQRLGGGVRCGNNFTGKVIFNRRYQYNFASSQEAQNLREQEGRRGLSICASNAGNLDPTGPMSVQVAADTCHPPPPVGNPDPSYI